VTDTTKQFKTQLPRNMFFQVLSFCTQVGVGIWLVPYLIRHLGTAAYGLIPIAGMLTQYISLISQSISSAVNRFLTIAIRKDDTDEANRIFSTAFFSYLGIGLLQLPLFAILLYYANIIISIPDELYYDTIILLACSAGTFLINLVASVFGVSMYANNRLDLARSIDISRYILRVVGIVTLFLIFGPALRYVGYVYLAISVLLCGAQVLIAKRLAPSLRLSLRYYDREKIKPLLGMGGWLVVNQIGALLFLQMDVWVCNRFISPDAGGEYAAVLQWPTLIRSGGAIISSVVAPMIIIYYAKSEIEPLIRLSKLSVRILSLVLAIPIAIMCAFSPTLLGLWLGESFSGLALVMVIMLGHLVINVGVIPLFNIQVATNRVRIPAMLTLLMGIMNLVLAISFVRFLGWGIYGVAIAGAIVLTAKNAIFTPIYTAKIMHEPWYTFVVSYLSALGLLIGLATIGYVISYYAAPDTWLQLALFSLGLSAVGLTAAWFILTKGDRQVMIALLQNRRNEKT
jgi:O-antigen/teichoic acid export membrane protein